MRILGRELPHIPALNPEKNYFQSNPKLRPFALICGIAFLPGLAFADAGYSSANFLKIGMGARAAAMADSFTAVADDATAIYWNPAGLALVNGTSLSTTHGQWLQGVSNDFFALSHQLEGNSVLGLGFINQSTQNFTSAQEDALGNYSGQGSAVNASDWALSAAYGNRLGQWIKGDFFQNTFAGLKATLVGQNALTPVGNAISFEAGFLHFLPQQRLTLGFDIQNVGTAIQNRSQPVIFKAGVSWYRPHNFQPGDRLTLAADLDLQDDRGLLPSFGCEYTSPLAKDFSGALRAGVRPTDDEYGLSFLTFGAGIVKSFNGFNAGLDYAFVPYGAIGPTHRFTLNLSLTSPEVKLMATLEGPSHVNQDSLVSFTMGAQADEGPGDWNLTLADSKGSAVRQLSGQGAPPSHFDWDGKNNSGEKVSPGSYQALLTVHDLKGQTFSTQPLAMTIDSVPGQTPASVPAQAASSVPSPAAESVPAPAAASVPSQPMESVKTPAAAVETSPLDQGAGYMKDGQWDKALTFFQADVAKNPNDLEAYRQMATCYFQMGRFDEAQKISDKLKTLQK